MPNGNPQPEDGTVRVASELWDALCRIRIPGEARQVFDFIVRKTYGYNKKMDWIALSQFVTGTGLSKPHIIDSIKKLRLMNIVTEKGNEEGRSYGVNKHYATWKPLPKKVTLPKKGTTITEKGKRSLPKKVPTIDSNTKDNLQKTVSSTKTGAPHPGVEIIMKSMEECFGTLDDTKAKNRQFAWNLLRKAKMDPAPCVALIRGAAKHDWWGSRITRVSDIYRNAHKIANALREGEKSKAVFIS